MLPYCFQRAEIRDGADILMVMVLPNICSNNSHMMNQHLQIIHKTQPHMEIGDSINNEDSNIIPNTGPNVISMVSGLVS